jgi:uncharacterized membrane protein YgdD (TMEM256/DUF423 family)
MSEYRVAMARWAWWPAIAAATAGGGAVVLGALGAHTLPSMVPATLLDVWHTAVRFQFWHALALAICALLAPRSRAAEVGAVLFALGILLFCGSLYALVLGAPRPVGFVTPLGGIAFIAGWIVLGVALYRATVASSP